MKGTWLVAILVALVVCAASAAGRQHISFTGDYETGNTSQWTWGAQCSPGLQSTDNSYGTVTIETDTVGQGKYAARFDLPASGVRNSCETLFKRQVGLGNDNFYGMMIRFPTDWQEPSPAGWGLSLAQFNFENIWGAPVSLNAHADHVSLVMQTGLCNAVSTSSPGCAYSSGIGGNVAQMAAVPAPLALGVWHELIVHVHWATSNGVVEVWHRIKGGAASWTKTVTLRGYPTVQWATTPSSVLGWTTADKIGAYRGAASFPLTVWQDGFVRATSFAAAAAALPQ